MDEAFQLLRGEADSPNTKVQVLLESTRIGEILGKGGGGCGVGEVGRALGSHFLVPGTFSLCGRKLLIPVEQSCLTLSFNPQTAFS